MDKYKWGTVTMLPDEHRLFPKDDDPVAVAIADNSGREPQDTEDGVLWLDFDRNLRIAHSGAGHKQAESFVIPLKDEQDNETRTITDAATVMRLASEFDWPVEDQTGIIYSVTNESL